MLSKDFGVPIVLTYLTLLTLLTYSADFQSLWEIGAVKTLKILERLRDSEIPRSDSEIRFTIPRLRVGDRRRAIGDGSAVGDRRSLRVACGWWLVVGGKALALMPARSTF